MDKDTELLQKLFMGYPVKTLTNKKISHALAVSKDLQFELNNTKPSLRKEREQLVKKLFGKTGESLLVESPFSCDFGYNITVGENFYANHDCVILDCAPVTIGDNVLLAPQVGLYAAGHPIDPEKRSEGYDMAKPITIGNNVWLGGGVKVIGGVTIGDNCVIGAGSVVIRDIPPNCVAAGNPCRVLRKIDERDKEYFDEMMRKSEEIKL